MSPELSPTLLRAGLELAGAVGLDDEPSGTGSLAPAPERLGAHHVVRYATAEEAESYRRIMRVLYDEHQAFGLRLRPAQVADRLRQRYAWPVDLDWLEGRLKALDGWGAVEADHDASLAATAAEWRRNRYTYDVTPAGRLTEELLAKLDALGQEIGRLDTARLPGIRDALALLAKALDQSEPDGAQLRQLFERVLAEVEALHTGALAFMRSLSDLMRTVEQVGEDEFERGKGALLEHLQGFRHSRSHYSAEILALLDQIERSGAQRLVAEIVHAEQFVALPGGATVEEQRLHRREELLMRWHGLRAWFVGDGDAGSPWRTLNDQVVDAIRAVLAIAERLIERRSLRVDRSGVLLALAARVVAAPPGQATAWLRAAFGVRTPRHVGVPDPDPEQVSEARAHVLARGAAGAGGRASAGARRSQARGRSGRADRRPDRGPPPARAAPGAGAPGAGRAAGADERPRPAQAVDASARRRPRVPSPAGLDRPRLRGAARTRRCAPGRFQRRPRDDSSAPARRARPRPRSPARAAWHPRPA